MNTILKITYIFLLLFCLNAQLLYGQQSCSDEIWSRYEKLVPTIKKLEKDKNFASVDSIYKEQITLMDQHCPCSYNYANKILQKYHGFVYYKLNKRDEALRMFDKKIKECTNINDSTVLLMQYRKALYCLRNDDYKNMAYHLDEAIKIGEEKFENNYRDLYASRYNKGVYYDWKNDHKSSLKCYLDNEKLLGDLPLKDTSIRITNLLSCAASARQIGEHNVLNSCLEKVHLLTKGSRFEAEVNQTKNQDAFNYYVQIDDSYKADSILQKMDKKQLFEEYEIAILYIKHLIKKNEIKLAKQSIGILDSIFGVQHLPKHQFFYVNLNLEKMRLGSDHIEDAANLPERITTSLHNNYINLINEGIEMQASNISVITSKYMSAVDLVSKYASNNTAIATIYDKLNNVKNISSNYYQSRQAFINSSNDEVLKHHFGKYKKLTNKLLEEADSEITLDSIDFHSKIIQQKMETAGIKWHTNTGLRDIRSHLQQSEAFIDFYQPTDKYSRNNMFAFIVTRDSFYFHKYTGFVDTLSLQAGQINYTNNGKKNKALYEYLIKPIVPYFSNKSKLFISTDGILNQIAIELLSPVGSKTQILEDQYEIAYIENSTALLSFTKTKQNKLEGNQFALIGGIKYNCIGGEDVIAGTDNPHTSRSISTYLPGSKREIDTIAAKLTKASYQNVVLSSCDATKLQVKQLLEDQKISSVHISTHGFIEKTEENSSNYFKTNLDAQLMLAKDKNQEDHKLTALDIIDIDMKEKELVFLSACNTGQGYYLPGLGNASVANAFKKAGAQKVVATLWSIPDDVTVELCDHFYTHYLITKDANEAMRNAKKALRNKYGPEKWAAFRVMN